MIFSFPSLRRALLARDKSCCYPGCSHDRWLDGHHIEHWADGGETKLSNVLLLCTTHHRLLHEGGYTIHRNFEGALYFRNSNGKVMPGVVSYKPTSDKATVLRQKIHHVMDEGDESGERNCVREPAMLYATG
jgi:hypothetical protein